MNIRLKKFEEKFRDVDLVKYFNLNHERDESVSIHKEIFPSEIHLKINYKKTTSCDYLNLPDELIEYIRDFLTYSIEVQIRVHYPLQYPFVPPVWAMAGVVHNLSQPVQLYYYDKVNYHNHYYNLYLFEMATWTPAISIETDILIFLQRIYHFEEMII